MFEYKKLNDLDIIVYCGGKCGSSTLHTTFKKNELNSYKIHDNNYFKYLCNLYKKDTTKTIFDVIDFNVKQNKNIYIIDVYRTPIERKISGFFQNISQHLPDYNKLSIQEMINFFNDKLLYILENYHSIDEILDHYNIQLFNTFDFKNKYNIFKNDNMIFIKLRFNDISEWSNILSTIFDKNITLYNDNLTSNKQINKLYNEFKETYTVPQSYIYDCLINDKAFKIYNTKEEQDKYISKWLKKSYNLGIQKNI